MIRQKCERFGGRILRQFINLRRGFRQYEIVDPAEPDSKIFLIARYRHFMDGCKEPSHSMHCKMLTNVEKVEETE
jgi:hypothetical protein